MQELLVGCTSTSQGAKCLDRSTLGRDEDGAVGRRIARGVSFSIGRAIVGWVTRILLVCWFHGCRGPAQAASVSSSSVFETATV